MSGIAFEHVSKTFPDGTVAVADVNLRIHDGEFCVLLGPSGCGKSTVLRLAAGLETPTHGTIRLGDQVLDDVAPKDRDIAMVFERSALYPHLDVEHNIGFALMVEGEPAADRAARVNRAARRLGIGELLRRQPRQLSIGQRQRTALGRAIVRRPRAFLMDEPLSDLDAKLRMEMRSELGRLHRDLATTTLYVTHDQAEAMALGDRVALMRRGTLEQVGEPQELYERPATLFVASFMGSPPMNLWHVRLIDRNGRLVVASGRQRLALPESVVAEHKGLRSHVGGHLVLGLRPESLVREGSGTAGALLELPVAEVEALGSHLLVHLEAEGAGMQLKDAGWRLRSGERDDADDGGVATFVRPTETLIARLPPHTQVKPGQFLRLGVKLERAHFFDPATQSALR